MESSVQDGRAGRWPLRHHPVLRAEARDTFTIITKHPGTLRADRSPERIYSDLVVVQAHTIVVVLYSDPVYAEVPERPGVHCASV